MNELAKVSSIENGEIRLVSLDQGENTIFYIDHVLEKCIDLPKTTWKKIIQTHFESYFAGLEFHKTLDINNFDLIKPYLSIRIYEENFVTDYSDNNWITQKNLEGTTSVLMMDLNTSFTTITRDVFEIWNRSEKELFAIAQQNINQKQKFKHTENFDFRGHNITVNFIQNESLGASMVLDLENNAPEFIGELGTIVAIPNKGFVILSRIMRKNPLEFMLFIQAHIEFVEKAYQQHPQRISPDFFWYYQGKFTQVQINFNKGEIEILAPMELSDLISKQKK